MMRRTPRFFRLTATVALGALLWDSALPLAAVAQPAPPPLPPYNPVQADPNQMDPTQPSPNQPNPNQPNPNQPNPNQPNPNQPNPNQPNRDQADPPARVGRIVSITGAVSFHDAGDTQWTAASVNYPVSSGNSFWAEPSAETQLEISDSRIVLAGATEFDLSTLDTRGLDAVLTQGEAYVHLRDLAPNEVWSIQTPRGLVRLSGNGRYEIVVGTADQPTLVTVLDGFAEIEGPSVSLRVSGNQTATISGTESFQGSIGPMLRDAFLIGRLNAERPPPAPVGVPSQVALMPGGADLYGAGRWSEAPEYGQVWYPPVSPGWVPYREGHWAYVAPWGWTWIDDAPWGFAPFHYGRWLEIGGRWAWTPGVVAVAGPPVYAPALVTFIGIGAGVALGAALASGSIGWVPLGPREPFRPWYHASDRYVREINFNHVTNNMRVVSNVTVNNFINRGAATSVPAAAMMGSRPVQGFARPVSAQEFASARPIFDRQPLRPTAATAGVTPAVARELNLPPGAGARPAPGPAVHPMAGGPGFAHPAFTPGARPEQARPELARPEMTRPEMTRPEMTRPELARPGPGNPAFHPGAGPAQASPQFNRPTVAEPGARPGESGFNRPMPGEGTPHPQPHVFNAPGAMPGQERHGFASPAGAPHSEPRGFAAPAAAPRPEPHGFTPPSGSRSEPRGFASPAGASRPEPHGFAPQRPEPGRPAQAPRPAPEAHERRPGER